MVVLDAGIEDPAVTETATERECRRLGGAIIRLLAECRQKGAGG